jgi:hypothetical protein
MILNSVVFGAWSHASRFESSESESTNIIFMNLHMHKANIVR